MNSYLHHGSFFLFFERFLETMSKAVTPATATTETISKAKVVLSPVTASSMESFIPRKFTGFSWIGSFVTADKTVIRLEFVNQVQTGKKVSNL